jgi:hypothetical protein
MAGQSKVAAMTGVQKLRRRVALLAVLSIATLGFGVAGSTPAQAVCGGGAPGEPCYCPSGIQLPVIKKTIDTGIRC